MTFSGLSGACDEFHPGAIVQNLETMALPLLAPVLTVSIAPAVPSQAGSHR